ncbi:unnamed protein product [Adineta steineri]|uniref:Hydroxysteroid dehydrogenase-like protein 2 n=1 Tax=Adineta steineri TaxID=433720 RepID=A0A815DGG3_9BILA|nr:unnamed protein product [Adineta steineri]
MPSLAGKTIFITGASRGIGLQIALRCAKDKANIIVAAKTTEPHPKLPGTIYTAAKEIEKAGGQCLPCVVDVRDEEQVTKAFEQAAQKFGGIDILINNASAISLTDTPSTPMKRYDLMHSINARGTFLCSKVAIPYLKKSSNPHILMNSPPISLNPFWFKSHVAYTVAKYNMSLFALGLSAELRESGIAVNTLWPKTAIDTDAINLIAGEDYRKRCRRPEIMADAAYAILTQDSRSCTGNFFVDEALLRQQGVTDFDQYAVIPGELNNSTSSFRKIPHVKVEALGYATVAFNCQTTDCRTVFSDGSSIDVFSNGTYSIYESDGEQFDINENGDILFDFQQSIYGKRVQELLSHIEPSKCIMSQNGDVIFDAVDYEQKQYCVEASGETYSKENDQQEISKDFPMEMHVPRFFIVHEDGSGTELLRFKDLYSYLRIMDLDPSTAVVREPLSSNPKVTGATVMRPFQDEIHRRWLTSFEDDSVIPASLRAHTSKPAITDSQDSSSFRQTDKNNQSSTFSNSFTNQQPILEMPKALDYRNFMEFPRLHDEIRFKLFNSLKNYVDFVTNRADHHTKLLPHDHRNRHEKEQANKIWKHARPQGTTKDDLALLYLKTVHPDRQKPTASAAPTKQSVIPLAQVFNLNHLHTQLHQEKKNKQLRRDMSKGIAMPYFQTEWGTAYTKQQQQQPEMISTRESRSAGYTKTTNGHENSLNSPPISPTNQQNRLSQIQKPQFTRSLSTEVADNKTLNSSGQSNLDSTYRPVKPFASPRNTVQYDAYGNKRANPVRIPNSLKGSRPHAEPHTRFLDMEEPVMVRPNNASIGAAALNNRPLRARRGCELFPDKLDFGVLKEGVTYGAEVNIKNVGIDACRFRVRQPPLGTGLRVVFQPGVLAAGISRPLTIELYAIIKQNYSQQQQQQQQQSQGLYQLDQSIEIITETDIMHFPIRAKIASEEQFEIMFVNKDGTAGMNKSVRLLARKSSNINDWIANTNKDTTDGPHE